MAKSRTIYECQECGYQTPKWQGRCFECGAFSSFQEVNVGGGRGRPANKTGGSRPTLTKLKDIKTNTSQRQATNVPEFDRVLNSGFVPGQVVLIGGEPGIGKSTLLLQVAANIKSEIRNSKSETNSKPQNSNNANKHAILYASAEESTLQIKSRADRLDIKSENLQLISDTDVDVILNQPQDSRPQLLVIDSIQTIFTSDIDSAAGNISQVQECTRKLVSFAKTTHTPVVIVGHVTKAGRLAGPKQLEHLVDTVLYLEGERYRDFRVLRSLKNRFGPVNEVGIFKMTGQGLESIENPAGEILSERQKNVPGSVLTVSLEGQRPLLLEIQALTSPSHYGNPRRTATGISRNRLEMLLAVLQKRAGLNFGNVDVYVNVSGGFKIREPAADLAVALALASSLKDKPIGKKVVAVGEVGLLGEVKHASRLDDRIKESKRLGFGEVISSELVDSLKSAISKTGIR